MDAKQTGLDLLTELQNKTRLLDKALNELGKRGRKKAATEAEYRKTLAVLMLKKREEGIPATILSDICRGSKEAARLKLERDIAEVDYIANLEAINAYKLNIRTLNDQIEREWHRE